MPRIRRRTRAALLAVALGALAWPSLPAAFRGATAARFDLARGHLAIQTFGLQTPGFDDMTRLLRYRYDVHVHAAAGCVVDSDEIAYVRAYNSVSKSAALDRFDHDVFEECRTDAQALWRQQWAQRSVDDDSDD